MAAFRFNDPWRSFAILAEPKVLLFAMLACLDGAGFAFGISASNALLISRVGADALFWVYFGSSVLSLVFVGIFYSLIGRWRLHTVFNASFILLACGILAFAHFLGQGNPPPWAFYAARIYFFSAFMLTNLELWALAGIFFTAFEAKRRFPIFVATNVAGMMWGGYLLDRFAAEWGVLVFFLLWGGSLLLSPVLVLGLGKKSRVQSTPKPIAAASPPRPPSTTRLAILLLLFWLTYTYLSYGVDYFFNRSAFQALGGENQLAAFFGKVGFFSLAVVLVYQLFLASFFQSFLRLDQAVGLIALLFFLGILSLPFAPSLPVLTFAEGLFYYFLDFAAVTLLLQVIHAFPSDLKGKVLTTAEGVGRPLGNMLLLALALLLNQGQSLLNCLLGGACLFLLYPVAFKKTYFRYLLECLDSGDPDLALDGILALGELRKKEAYPPLAALLAKTEEPAMQREIVLAFGKIRSPEALPQVIALFSQSNESIQLAVLESLALYKNYESLFALYGLSKSQDNVSFQVRMNATWLLTRLLGKKMLPLLFESFQDEDPRIKANAVESIALLREKQTIPGLLPCLEDENRRLRANAAVALHAFRATRGKALRVIRELFDSSEVLDRFSAIYAIGELGLFSYQAELLVLLANPDPRVQQHLITALAKMRIPEYCGRFVDFLLSEDEGLAQESIRNLSRFPEASRWLVFEKISRLSAKTIEKIILSIGRTPLDFSKEIDLLRVRKSPSLARNLGG